MSLIHEALQKAEAERRAGELPPLLSASAFPHRKPGSGHRHLYWLLPAIVLAGALGYSNIELIRGDADASSEAPEPAQRPKPATQAAESSLAPATKPANVQAQDEILPGVPAGVLTPAPVVSAPTPSADPAAASPALPDIPAPVPLPAEVAPNAAAPEPAPRTDRTAIAPDKNPPETPVDTNTPVSAPPEAPAMAAPAAPAPPAATPASGLPYVFELPLATRQALPALKVTMQVYHRDPAQRFAIIDGKRVNENGVVGNELNLIEIQRDAMILEFRGTRFLLPRLGL